MTGYDGLRIMVTSFGGAVIGCAICDSLIAGVIGCFFGTYIGYMSWHHRTQEKVNNGNQK
jgi:uncharacterized membrane protein